MFFLERARARAATKNKPPCCCRYRDSAPAIARQTWRGGLANERGHHKAQAIICSKYRAACKQQGAENSALARRSSTNDGFQPFQPKTPKNGFFVRSRGIRGVTRPLRSDCLGIFQTANEIARRRGSEIKYRLT